MEWGQSCRTDVVTTLERAILHGLDQPKHSWGLQFHRTGHQCSLVLVANREVLVGVHAYRCDALTLGGEDSSIACLSARAEHHVSTTIYHGQCCRLPPVRVHECLSYVNIVVVGDLNSCAGVNRLSTGFV